VAAQAGCPHPADAEGKGPAAGELIIAAVGEEPITAAEFERAWHRSLVAADEPGGMAAIVVTPDAAVRRALLEQFVDWRLLAAEARRRGLVPDRSRVAAEVRRLEAAQGELRLKAHVLESGDTLADLLRRVTDRMAVEALLLDEVEAAGAVTDEDVARHHAEHAVDFERPEEVRALQVVVETSDKASKVLAELKAGADFGEIARRYGTTPEAGRGGDLGFFARGEMPPVFDEACFGLAPGQQSGVVVSEYGYHIFRVVERRPTGLRALAEVREEIRATLARARARAVETRLVERLRAATPVRVWSERLDATKGDGP
jgi:peptidyl-prolyl cis-trans isomerase C/foldase protein PrsA